MHHIIISCIILCLASAAQSAVGFGYALFATPLLVWVGIPLQNVVTLVSTCSMIQSMIGVGKLRAEVPWRLSLTAVAIRLVSVVTGLILLKKLVDLNTEHIRAVIGGILCVLVIIQLIWKPQPVKKMHWGWAGLAFIGSGLLAGLCGMGGPPLVLWSMAHDWSTQKTRGFLFAVFAISIPVQLVLLSVVFGAHILWFAAMGIAFVPIIYLGAAVGLPVGNRMAKNKLQHVAYAILLVIGVSSIAPVFIKML